MCICEGERRRADASVFYFVVNVCTTKGKIHTEFLMEVHSHWKRNGSWNSCSQVVYLADILRCVCRVDRCERRVVDWDLRYKEARVINIDIICRCGVCRLYKRGNVYLVRCAVVVPEVRDGACGILCSVGAVVEGNKLKVRRRRVNCEVCRAELDAGSAATVVDVKISASRRYFMVNILKDQAV